MKRLWFRLVTVSLCILLSLLIGCTEQYECEIWQYSSGSWSYYTWDVYTGKDSSNAESSCEDDWGSSYDCRGCVPE